MNLPISLNLLPIFYINLLPTVCPRLILLLLYRSLTFLGLGYALHLGLGNGGPSVFRARELEPTRSVTRGALRAGVEVELVEWSL